MSRKVLVTGGGGFIGSNLVRGLLAHGDDVRVLDNFSTGSRTNLDEVTAEVTSARGNGTRVRLEMPLPPRSSPA